MSGVESWPVPHTITMAVPASVVDWCEKMKTRIARGRGCGGNSRDRRRRRRTVRAYVWRIEIEGFTRPTSFGAPRPAAPCRV